MQHSIYETFSYEETKQILSRVKFHYTPKHASWLNIAEVEINVMDVECIGGRIKDSDILSKEVAIWSKNRNLMHKTIDWSFTRRDADRKLSKFYD